MFASLFKVIGTLCVVGIAVADPASAADGIGRTVGLTPAATGTVAGRLSLETPVFQNETIETGPSGVAEIMFLDETHLAMGSSSSVKLDRFVYQGDRKASGVVIGLARGAFRFATGDSPKKAYRIDTPLASIGVRGTGLLIDSQAAYTIVTLEHGGATVCSAGGKTCADLDKAGQSVAVLRNGTVRRVRTPARAAMSCSQTGQGSVLCASLGKDRASTTTGTGTPNISIQATVRRSAPPAPPTCP